MEENKGRLLVEILDRVIELPCHHDANHRVSVPARIFDTSNGRIFEGAGIRKQFYGGVLETGAYISPLGMVCCEKCYLDSL